MERGRPPGPWKTLVLVGGLALATGPAQALTLYDNGPVIDPAADGRCDSGISFSCGGDGDWTFYDDFRLAGDATLTGFDYVDWFSGGGPADYVDTDVKPGGRYRYIVILERPGDSPPPPSSPVEIRLPER